MKETIKRLLAPSKPSKAPSPTAPPPPAPAPPKRPPPPPSPGTAFTPKPTQCSKRSIPWLLLARLDLPHICGPHLLLLLFGSLLFRQDIASIASLHQAFCICLSVDSTEFSTPEIPNDLTLCQCSCIVMQARYRRQRQVRAVPLITAT